MRWAIAVLLVLVAPGVFGCNDSTEPDRFPDVSGTWDVSGIFEGFPAGMNAIQGTVTVEREDGGELSGDASIRTPAGSAPVRGLRSARVDEAGRVTFSVGPSDAWAFVGQVAGDRMSGTHQIVGDPVAVPRGTWTAERAP